MLLTSWQQVLFCRYSIKYCQPPPPILWSQSFSPGFRQILMPPVKLVTGGMVPILTGASYTVIVQPWWEWVKILKLYFHYMLSVCAQSLQSCPTLCDPVDCTLPGLSVHGILQARILEWVAISFSRGSSQPRNQNCISCIFCITVGFFTTEPQGKPICCYALYKTAYTILYLFIRSMF